MKNDFKETWQHCRHLREMSTQPFSNSTKVHTSWIYALYSCLYQYQYTYIHRYKHLYTHIKWATSILRSVGNKRLTAISFPCQLWNKKEMLPVNTERVRGCVHKMVIWMCLCEWVCDCVCVCVCFGWCIMNKRTSNSPAQTRHRNDELGSFVGSWANWWIWIETEHQIIQILLNSRLH